MVAISFLFPKLLFLLLLIPIFLFFYFISSYYPRKRSVVFPNFEAMQRIYPGEFLSKNIVSLYLNLAILFFLIFGVAGTVISFEAETSSFSYVLAIDNSGSMKTSDVLPDRLAVAKESSKVFISNLPTGVEVGIISFGGQATVLQELTNSKMRLYSAIDLIEFGDVGGTNVYNVLVASNNLLESKSLKSIVLVSDGQNNVGDASEMINYAKKRNLIINTIAIGTEEGGSTDLETISKVDIDFLKSLAFNTEGNFFQVKDKYGLDESFSSILATTKKEVSTDVSLYLFLIAILLFSITWILSNFRFRVFP